MRQQRWGKLKAVLLVVITYVFAKFQGGFSSWFLFYSSLVFLVYEALAYFLMFSTLEVERHIDRNRLQDGEDVVVTVRLRRRIRFPLGWHMVVEPLPERLAGVYEPHRQLIFPWFKKELEFRYVIPSLRSRRKESDEGIPDARRSHSRETQCHSRETRCHSRESGNLILI